MRRKRPNASNTGLLSFFPFFFLLGNTGTMSRMYAQRSVQQERLAQLSDDNAFVDVEAALRRMGEDTALDVTAPASFDAAGKAVSGSRGSSAGQGKWVYAGRGSRVSENALLSGARVPLTASLQEQHKAYMESVRLAAKAVEEMNSSSSSSDEDDHYRDDHCSGESIDDAGVGGGSANRTRAKSSAQQRKSGRKQRGSTAMASSTMPAAAAAASLSLSEPVVAVSVQTVKKEAAESIATASSARTRKRSRERGEVSMVKMEKADTSGNAGEALKSSDCLQRRPCNDEDGGADSIEERSAAVVSQALVSKLYAELRLVEQWRRTVLDSPPQIINGVLSPELNASWTKTFTTTTTGTDAKDSCSSSTPPQYLVDSFSQASGLNAGGAEEPVLPYPLLLLYSLCPSYEALAAAPVHRRSATRVTAEDDEDDDEKVELAAVASLNTAGTLETRLPTSVRQTRAVPSRVVNAMSATDSLAVLTRTIHVSGIAFSIPIARRRRRVSGGKTASILQHRPAGLVDYPAAGGVSGTDSTGGDGVQGTRQHHLCSVCMLPASYRCVRCRVALFCSIECHVMHDATRCLKFTV